MRFIDELDSQYGDDIITVVIPEFVTSWGTQWLHNGSAFALKARLLHRPHTAVVSVPIHLHDGVVEESSEDVYTSSPSDLDASDRRSRSSAACPVQSETHTGLGDGDAELVADPAEIS